MQFHYQLKPNIPCLAWCLELDKNSGHARVLHGAQVETSEQGFFEGAWDEPLADRNFDRAKTLIGSGVMVRDNELVICASTDFFDKLFVLRDGDRLWASNSLVYLLVRSGRELDIHYPWYLYDFLDAKRWGLRKKYKFLHLAGGEKLLLLDFCNLRINQGLNWQREEKPLYPESKNFDEYHRLVQAVTKRITANAADPSRIASYSPITAISHGYDSTAVSVLASQAGCQDAFTFVTPQAEGGKETDDGSAVAAMLGLKVHAFSRYACHDLPGMPEAEFQATCPDATGSVIASAEPLLANRLCFQGNAGEDIWEISKRYDLPENLCPDSVVTWPLGEKEFRLRVGYLQFNMPLISYQHREAIESISKSEEMKPWSIKGTDYNRPIARRIIEEAGIPRGSFASYKVGGAYTRHPWSEESQRDFDNFLASNDIPAWFLRGWWRPMDWLMLPLDGLYVVHKRYLRSVGFKHLLPLLMRTKRRSLDYRRRFKTLYSMHWGVEKIRHRYED